jgi:NTE family protein
MVSFDRIDEVFQRPVPRRLQQLVTALQSTDRLPSGECKPADHPNLPSRRRDFVRLLVPALPDQDAAHHWTARSRSAYLGRITSGGGLSPPDHLRGGLDMATSDDTRTIAIGLQGGGSHTAFSWGVLDVLLDKVAESKLTISAISGASGGALNGAVCAYGLIKGPQEAKRLLEDFWVSVASKSRWPENLWRSMLFPTTSPERWNVDLEPLAIGFGMAEQITSPYWNPLSWHNILRPLLENVIPDFTAFGAPGSNGPKLFVSATAIDRTALRIFGPEEITVNALLASACLPTLFESVEIDGVPYWDGGYMANPALAPLVGCADDLLTVLIDPLNIRSGPPQTPRHIVNRINEVSFNSSWVLEIRQIELINKLVRDNYLKDTKYTEKRFHLISNDRWMEAVGATSKIVPSRDFLFALRDIGRQAAVDWVAENFDKIGHTSSLDVQREVALRMDGSHKAVTTLAP